MTKLAASAAEERRRGVIAMSAGNHAQARRLPRQPARHSRDHRDAGATPLVKVENTRAHGARSCSLARRFYEAAELGPRVSPPSEASPSSTPTTTPLSWPARAPSRWRCWPTRRTSTARRADRRRRAYLGHRHRRQGPEARRSEIVGVEAALYPSFHNAIRGEDRPIGGADAWPRASRSRPSASLPSRSSRDLVDDIVLVEEAAIERAVNALCDASADHGRRAPAPPALPRCSPSPTASGAKVGLVLCGGNIDRAPSRLRDGARARTGRPHRSFRITSNDRPGLLGRVASRLGRTRRQYSGGFPRPVVSRCAGQRRFHRHHYRNARQRSYIGGVPGPRG